MKNPERRSAAFLLIVCAAAVGCTHASPTAPRPTQLTSIWTTTTAASGESTPEVSTEELREILASGSALVLDNRPAMEFSLGHIPGAINVAPKPGMPISEYTSDVAEITRIVRGDRARPLVLYCNGPFCGKSKRVAADLIAAGYTNVRRYQLGAPVWRALGGVMQIERDAARHVLQNDGTAWIVDARSSDEFRAGSLPRAVNVRAGQVHAAKDDRRLPMEDHNTRIIVVGSDAAQAREFAEEMTRNAFHNVTFYAGGWADLR